MNVSSSRLPSRAAVGLAGLRWLALWVVPALLAAVAVRYLLPEASDPFEPASERSWARPLAAYGSALWAVLFMLLALTARYWLRGVLELPESSSAVGHPRPRAVGVFGAVVAAALAAALLGSSFFQSCRVTGDSMLPGIAPGSLLAVNKLAYGLKLPGLARRAGGVPRRGDLVVFRAPEGEEAGQELVKRVVGLPGDRIRVAGMQPVINGFVPAACKVGPYPLVSAEETRSLRLFLEFLDDKTYSIVVPVADDGSEDAVDYLVKPGEVFVMGDNRSGSRDSRAWNHGHGRGVPLASVIGRVDRVLVDGDRNGRLDFGRVSKPLGLELHLFGMDAAELEGNVAGCVKLRPKDTTLPAPGSSAAP